VGGYATRRIGHGPVRYVGPIGAGYFLFCVFAAFCAISIVVGLIYLAWPYILGVVLAGLVVMAMVRSRHH
jgi:hypothetical protein